MTNLAQHSDMKFDGLFNELVAETRGWPDKNKMPEHIFKLLSKIDDLGNDRLTGVALNYIIDNFKHGYVKFYYPGSVYVIFDDESLEFFSHRFLPLEKFKKAAFYSPPCYLDVNMESLPSKMNLDEMILPESWFHKVHFEDDLIDILTKIKYKKIIVEMRTKDPLVEIDILKFISKYFQGEVQFSLKNY